MDKSHNVSAFKKTTTRPFAQCLAGLGFFGLIYISGCEVVSERSIPGKSTPGDQVHDKENDIELTSLDKLLKIDGYDQSNLILPSEGFTAESFEESSLFEISFYFSSGIADKSNTTFFLSNGIMSDNDYSKAVAGLRCFEGVFEVYNHNKYEDSGARCDESGNAYKITLSVDAGNKTYSVKIQPYIGNVTNVDGLIFRYKEHSTLNRISFASPASKDGAVDKIVIGSFTPKSKPKDIVDIPGSLDGQVVTNTWLNIDLTDISSSFSVSFNITPQELNQDIVIGLSQSQSDFYTSLAASVRLGTNNTFEAMNGTSYDKTSTVFYAENVTYNVMFEVFPVIKKYSVFVSSGSGAPVKIADRFAYRTSQSHVSKIRYLAAISPITDATLQLNEVRNIEEPTLDSFTVSVSKLGTGDGSLFLDGQACGNSCQVTVLEGSRVEVKATVGVNSAFGGWSNGPCASAGTTCSFNVSSDYSFNAEFNPYTAPVIASEHCKNGIDNKISQYGITWFFDQSYSCGQFVNGDYYVIGPVKITNITPKEGDHNGSMLNPIPHQPQGFYHATSAEFRIPAYDSSLNLAKRLPVTIQPGNSLYSVMKNPNTWGPTTALREKVWFKETAVLTVLSSAPPQGSFRPPYAGTDKTIKANWKSSAMNYNALKKLSVPVAAHRPNQAWLVEATKRPLLEMHYNYVNSQWKAAWAESKTGGFPRRTYGREVSRISSEAGLLLNTDMSNHEKERLLINMVQWGIDVSGLIKVGMRWQANGGHQHGRLMPLFIAAKVLGDSEMLEQFSNHARFQEYIQHYFITQADIDRPRKNNAEPYNQSHLGMPEWSSGGLAEQAQASSNWNATGYRFINGGPNTGLLATILIMGGRTEMRHEAFARYMITRYIPIAMGGATHTIPRYGDVPSLFARDMWNAHVKATQ
jgi:hypothetical protein